jgi:hypothetical protein
MVHALSYALGCTILDELESQIILRLSSQNAYECGKLKNVNWIVCGTIKGRKLSYVGQTLWVLESCTYPYVNENG